MVHHIFLQYEVIKNAPALIYVDNFIFSEWPLVKLVSLDKLLKDLWEWNQDSTAHLYQSPAKVWRKMRGTQQTDEAVSREEMSRFVYVFNSVTVAFRFHECLVDEAK